MGKRPCANGIIKKEGSWFSGSYELKNGYIIQRSFELYTHIVFYKVSVLDWLELSSIGL